MHLLIIKQAATDLASYKSRLRKRGDTYEELSWSEFKWKDGEPDWQWLRAYCSDLYETRRETIDVIKFFLTDWQLPKENGFPVVGRAYYGRCKYPVHLVRIRAKDDDTAEHEDLHTVNNAVRVYSGISLSKIMGVADFDEDVVHGRDHRFKEYHYEKVWEIIQPYVTAAYRKRKQLGLLSALERAVILLRELQTAKKVESIHASPAAVLLEIAHGSIGKDASPSDLAPDELGCAETVSTLLSRVFPHFPIVTGTWSLLDVLRGFPGIQEVEGEPEPGDIMLYATGEGVGIFPGHVVIVGENRTIMSNNSPTGTFEQNYTVETFRQRYVRWGGFPEHIFRLTTKTI